MKPRMLPERSGSHLAGIVERRRAANEYLRIQKANQSTTEEKKVSLPMSNKGTQKKKFVSETDRLRLLRMVEQDIEGISHWLAGSDWYKTHEDPVGCAKSILRSLVNPEDAHRSRAFSVMQYVFDNYATRKHVEIKRAETVVVEVIGQEPQAQTTAIEKPQSEVNPFVSIMAAMMADSKARDEKMMALLTVAMGSGSSVNKEPIRPQLPSYGALPIPEISVPKADESSLIGECIDREVARRRQFDTETPTGDIYRAVRADLYRQYRLRTKYSVKKGDDASVQQHIKDQGHIKELYAIAYEMFAGH